MLITGRALGDTRIGFGYELSKVCETRNRVGADDDKGKLDHGEVPGCCGVREKQSVAPPGAQIVGIQSAPSPNGSASWRISLVLGAAVGCLGAGQKCEAPAMVCHVGAKSAK